MSRFLAAGLCFFAKEPSNVEVINDTNNELHSRDAYRQATVMYNHSDMFTPVQRAWALWVLSSQTFASSLENSWGFSVSSPSTAKRITNKKANFDEGLRNRLSMCTFENADAIEVIKRFDRPDSFFYLDPPYFNSDCGHYDGYSVQDFANLLGTLAQIRGKFLLSSYPSELLKQFIKDQSWHFWTIEKKVSVNAKSGYLKAKTECLTSNYSL